MAPSCVPMTTTHILASVSYMTQRGNHTVLRHQKNAIQALEEEAGTMLDAQYTLHNCH